MMKSRKLISAYDHPMRKKILELMLTESALSVQEVAKRIGLVQSSTSRHLLVLKSAGFLESRRVQFEMHYSRTRECKRYMNTILKLETRLVDDA